MEVEFVHSFVSSVLILSLAIQLKEDFACVFV